MRGDNLKRHRKHHEKKTYSIDETHSIGHTAGEMKHVDEAQSHRREKSSEKCTNIDLEKFGSDCFAEVKDFERKIGLGQM